MSGFSTDIFHAISKAGNTTCGNTCAQIFVSDKCFVVIYPMKSKVDFIVALHLFYKEVRVPPTIAMDPAGEQKRNDVRKFLHQAGSILS